MLDIPILYLSRHINQHKAEYYRLLQSVREDGDWEAWVLYILEAVEKTSRTTLALVEGIRKQMADVKQRLRTHLPRLYSQDLLNNLFRHPYSRIQFVRDDLSVTRQTAADYLEQLVEKGFLEKHKSGRSNYYINRALVTLSKVCSGARVKTCRPLPSLRSLRRPWQAPIAPHILMLGGETVTVGSPLVAGAAVQAEVIDQIKGKKVIHFVKRRRKHSSQRTKGHRQHLTLVRVTDIIAEGADATGVAAATGTAHARRAAHTDGPAPVAAPVAVAAAPRARRAVARAAVAARPLARGRLRAAPGGPRDGRARAHAARARGGGGGGR